ncbi:MAG TPA: class I SAM-dependent methyltransferase [Roseiflexaceae bacterium]|nr:class I SAM-dependent methyltransferase [Roseiflexaceae bacterium]
MGCYASYAPIYDATGQGHAGAALARQVASWLRGRGHAPRAALDLACGTGDGALALAEAGIHTFGVDRSPTMLAIARGRARDAGLDVQFLEMDIRAAWTNDQRPTTHETEAGEVRSSFVIRRSSFDLVTCFGTLNELVEDGDLERVFGAAAGLLRPGGYVAFDLWADADLMARDGADVMLHDGPDHLVYARLILDGRGGLGQRRIVWFVREIDRWWRGEEVHPLRAWRDEEVYAALGSAGLMLVEQWTAGEEAVRRVYLAQPALAQHTVL